MSLPGASLLFCPQRVQLEWTLESFAVSPLRCATFALRSDFFDEFKVSRCGVLLVERRSPYDFPANFDDCANVPPAVVPRLRCINTSFMMKV